MARSSPSRAAKPDTTTEFGDEVWPGAAALAQALAPSGVFGGAVRGKRVLELGAGGGLPGLVCAASGAASVVLSDLPEALPRLRQGIRQNDLSQNCVVKALDWRSGDSVIRSFPIITSKASSPSTSAALFPASRAVGTRSAGSTANRSTLCCAAMASTAKVWQHLADNSEKVLHAIPYNLLRRQRRAEPPAEALRRGAPRVPF